MTIIRIGILGAAGIAPSALIAPARQVADVEVTAIAARDRQAAQRFAAKHGIARVHDNYAALVADPDLDAVYIPLPNSLHAPWAEQALLAGKHVLCEKPFTSNAAEAERLAALAEHSGLVLMEAFHYRYHPLMVRAKEIIDSGEIGSLRHIDASFCIPLFKPRDIRWRWELAGGATMDVGCYTIHLIRSLGGGEPQVRSAQARVISPQVDRRMAAEFDFADGVTASMTCSMLSPSLLRVGATITGSRGEIRILNPWLPHRFHRFTVRTPAGRRRERFAGDSTYTHQLRAFVAWVRGGPPALTDGRDAVGNMRVIDAVYRAAGLRPRRG
jgi:predicted dehydrogenase